MAVASVVGQRTGKTYMLGRRDPIKGKPTLRLAYYIDDLGVMAANIPATLNLTDKAMESIKRVMHNDQYGCCVISDRGHSFGVWTANRTGTPIIATDDEILAAYRIFNPGHQDNGCVITEVLDYYRDKGLRFGGQIRKIKGYVSVDWTNPDLVKAAVYLFGANTLGIDLPSEWTGDEDVWDVTNSRNVGGHDVPTFGWDEKGFTIATWGGLRTITYSAYDSKKYLSECYACLSDDWTGSEALTPLGVRVDELAKDLALIEQGRIPEINPDAIHRFEDLV